MDPVFVILLLELAVATGIVMALLRHGFGQLVVWVAGLSLLACIALFLMALGARGWDSLTYVVLMGLLFPVPVGAALGWIIVRILPKPGGRG